MTQHLLPLCVCGSAVMASDTIQAIPVLRCGECGVIRQLVEMTPEQLGDWYRDDYYRDGGKCYHTYAQDRAVAVLRLNAYGFKPGTRILDVGSGNNAFVDEAISRGIDALGQDLDTCRGGSPFVYTGPLEEIAFPTDSFDAVTVHDVLEHMVDPKAALAEMARITKPGGRLIVDFPRFHDAAGVHHWKPVEHLWMFTEAQLIALIKEAGFDAIVVVNPIPSKVVVIATRAYQERPKILTPAGIGDTYWVIVKLRSFLKKHGLGLPELLVQDSGGPKRTHPFVETIPFVHAGGYHPLKGSHPLFNEAYMQNARTVYKDVLGVDYFIAYNGVMRFGRSLEEVDPEYECEWFPRMHVSKRATAYQAALEKEGPYCVVYIVDAGMYKRWLSDFPAEKIRSVLLKIEAITGFRMVFLGASWDTETTGWKLAEAEPRWTNLIGKTSYEDMVGTLSGASLVLGWPSGATILGTVLRRPTVMFWNRYFRKGFWTNSCPAGTPYEAIDTFQLTEEQVVAATLRVLGR